MNNNILIDNTYTVLQFERLLSPVFLGKKSKCFQVIDYTFKNITLFFRRFCHFLVSKDHKFETDNTLLTHLWSDFTNKKIRPENLNKYEALYNRFRFYSVDQKKMRDIQSYFDSLVKQCEPMSLSRQLQAQKAKIQAKAVTDEIAQSAKNNVGSLSLNRIGETSTCYTEFHRFGYIDWKTAKKALYKAQAKYLKQQLSDLITNFQPSQLSELDDLLDKFVSINLKLEELIKKLKSCKWENNDTIISRFKDKTLDHKSISTNNIQFKFKKSDVLELLYKKMRELTDTTVNLDPEAIKSKNNAKEWLKKSQWTERTKNWSNQKIETESAVLDKWIDKLKTSKAKYVNFEVLPFDIHLKLTKYVLGSELMHVVNNLGIDQMHILPELNSLQKFSFKVGLENQRELLMNQIIECFGLNFADYLVPKFKAKLNKAKLLDIDSPEGIVSTWIKRERDFPYKLWIQYKNLKAEIALAEFQIKLDPKKEIDAITQMIEVKNNNISKLKELFKLHQDSEELENQIENGERQISYYESLQEKWKNYKKPDLVLMKQKLNEIENKIISIGGENSVYVHALMDLIFWSFDSHPEQYIFCNGEFYNIDFSRFLPLSEVLTRRKDNQKVVVLGSTFLSHPLAFKKIPDELVQSLVSFDISNVQKILKNKGLIESRDFFDTRVKDLETLNNNLKRFIRCHTEVSQIENLDVVYLQKRCKELKIKTNENDRNLLKAALIEWNESKLKDLEQLYGCSRNEFAEVLTKKIDDIYSEIYAKIHPQAFENMCNRIEMLQNYVKQTSEPTLDNAIEVMFPVLKPFFDVLRRIEGLSSQFIGLNHKEKTTRTLEEILELASEKRLANPQELQEMQHALSQLKRTAPQAGCEMLSMNTLLS